jgi:redox-sensing transcriptional repressor
MKDELSRKIPKTIIYRLSVYYRALSKLEEKGVKSISSYELSQIVGFTAAQIRKDLTYFGQFGRPGKGYDVSALRDSLKDIIGINRSWRVALVGVGFLGRALLAYKGFRKQQFVIVCAFDNDPKKIGQKYNNIEVFRQDRMKEIINKMGVEIVILTVPTGVADSIINELARTGIKAVLSFSPLTLLPPDSMKVNQVDLSVELEGLSYYLSHLED